MKIMSKLAALGAGILLASTVSVGIALPAHATGNHDNEGVCQPQSAHIKPDGDVKSITIDAPEGKVIVATCVKAGSIKQGNGPEYQTYDPGVTQVVLAHSSGKDISHYTVTYADKPKPNQPDPLTGTDTGSNPAECVEPLDGTATITSWTQAWSQAYVWDAKSWTWVLGEKVYEEKVYTEGEPFESEVCEPPVEEPEVVVPQAPVVKDKCGVGNDHYGLPEGPTGITYSRDGLDIIATADEGYVLGTLPAGWVAEEGGARYPFSATEWTDEPCSEEPETPEPTVETTYGEWTGGEPTCEIQEVEQTRTVTITETTYGWVWEDDAWKPTAASSIRQGEPETRTVVWEGEDCPVTEPPVEEPPTEEPPAKPPVTPAGQGGDEILAATGGAIVNPYVPTIAALAVALGIACIAFAIMHSRRRPQAVEVRDEQ